MWEKVYDYYVKYFMEPELIYYVDLSEIPGYVPPLDV